MRYIVVNIINIIIAIIIIVTIINNNHITLSNSDATAAAVPAGSAPAGGVCRYNNTK